MRHYILAKFQADAGDWHGYLPRIREIFGAAGEIPGVRGAAVYPGCVDRENRYHVLIELEMEPSAFLAVSGWSKAANRRSHWLPIGITRPYSSSASILPSPFTSTAILWTREYMLS